MINLLKKIYCIIRPKIKYMYLKKLPSEKYETFIIKEYSKRTGQTLDFNNIQKYTEKMQYSKLYCNTPLKTKLTDKYLVREWVKEKIGSKYLIPLLGVWDEYSDINFDELPDRFVLKTNHGSGWNLLVTDKREIVHWLQKKRFDKWMRTNFSYYTDLQLHYKDIKPKIIAEQFIQDSNSELTEYKFFCFDGVVYYCWFRIDKDTHGYGNIYDLNWNLQPWIFRGRDNTPYEIPKPKKFEEMIEIATKLAQGFSHVRVDLYDVDGRIYFGEMTFTSTGGYRLVIPEKYDYHLGSLWDVEVH